MDLGWKSVVLVSCATLGCRSQGVGSAAPETSEDATRVTLTRRTGGEYGTSAYSFRYASQELAVHHNYVDLVLNNCGQVHINAHGGQENRIAKVAGGSLGDVTALPMDGWLEHCFRPEKDALYVLDVNDGDMHFPVRLRVIESEPDEVTLEWERMIPKGNAGGMGMCGGEHGSS